MGSGDHLPSLCWDFGWLALVQDLCRQAQLLWHHECYNCTISRRKVTSWNREASVKQRTWSTRQNSSLHIGKSSSLAPHWTEDWSPKQNEFKNINIKRINNIINKWGPDLIRELSIEESQMAARHLRKCSNSLIIRGMLLIPKICSSWLCSKHSFFLILFIYLFIILAFHILLLYKSYQSKFPLSSHYPSYLSSSPSSLKRGQGTLPCGKSKALPALSRSRKVCNQTD